MRCYGVLIVGLCMLFGVVQGLEDDVRTAYKKWLDQYSQQDSLQNGGLARFRLFQNNYQFVSQLLTKKLGFDLEMNQFATMSQDELNSFVGVNLTEVLELRISQRPPSLSSVPLSKDHRRDTGLTPPRALDHTHCGGGSWAYSAIAVLESKYKILTDEIPLFSEQELLDCSYKDGRNACHGGYMTTAFEHVQSAQHIGDARHYPTYGSTGSCRQRDVPNAMTRTLLRDYGRLPAGEDNLMREVATGPVAVGIRAERSLYFYRSGLYDPSLCWSGDINHAVTAVGYQPDRWIIKNSWGSGWGALGGYAYLSRRHDNVCKIASYPVTATLESRLSSTDDDWCPHVPVPDREPCWHDSDYAWDARDCRANRCCWDDTTRQCYVKAKITLYERRNFQGLSATFYGSIPDLARYGISRVAHSLHVHYGNFMTYTKPNYGKDGGNSDNYSFGVLSGDFPNLDDYSMSHAIVSLRALSSGRDVVTLFTDTHARGSARAFYKQISWVGWDWNDKFSSGYTTGSWELCEHTNLNGHCTSISSGLSGNFHSNNDEISSAKSQIAQ